MRAHAAAPPRGAAAALAVVVAAASLLVAVTAHAAVTETGSERFGGRDRYETSVAIAEAYLAEIADNPDRSDTSAVIVVSGENRHAVYAMPAAGLAAAFDAPIVQTPSGELHRGVAGFLDEHEFELALVLGGTGVVSAAVVDELVDRVGSVQRISGPDAYVTAVAVAGEVGPIPGSAGEWGSRGRTALLANGETIADALVAGPLAYHGEHPLLLTPAASLDRRVSDYLDQSDVEHVVILGGTAAVGTAVESEVKAKDIGTTRLAGDDRYGTAALLARQLLGSGRPDPCFDGSSIGLAVGDRAPDAVSSGPLLGERCAPLLLTEPHAVPTALDDLLTGGDLLGGSNSRLEVAVFGGTAAIAEPTVIAVRNRAVRGGPFSAAISATAGSTVFTVTFNEDVKEEEAIRFDRYTVNNTALVAVDEAIDNDTRRQYVQISLSGRVVTVELVQPLVVGNTITVLGETGIAEGRTEIAVDDTLPALESVFYRVPRAAVVRDTTGPQIQIVAIADKCEFVVLVTESAPRHGDRLRNDVIYRGKPVHELTVVGADGKPKEVTFEASEDDSSRKPKDPCFHEGPLLDKAKKIGEERDEDPATLGADLSYTASVTDALKAGDVITVAKGALHDQRRNPSRLTRYTVTEHADEKQFKVAQAAVGTARHTKQASLLISNAREGGKSLRIIAKSTGVAAGAAGNSWVVYPYVDPDRREPAESKIEVGVDTVHRRISYTIVDGKITLANLAAALNRNSTFDSNFSASVVTSIGGPISISGASGHRLSGGESKVGVRVRFTDHVKTVTDATDFKPAQRFAYLFLDVGDSSHEDVDVRCLVRCLRRGPVVYLEYVATDDALVPRAGTPVRVPAGVTENYAGATNLTQRTFNLRLDAEIPDQFGYEQKQLDDGDADGLRCDGDTS